MFSSISWREFVTCLCILLVFYYAIIVMVYYQNELLKFRSLLLSRTMRGPDSKMINNELQSTRQPINEPVSHETFMPNSEADEHTLLNELLEKLEEQITNAAKRNLIKEELLVSIQQVLAQYANLQYSTFVSSIENYIQSTVENQCSIYLTDQEVSFLWKK